MLFLVIVHVAARTFRMLFAGKVRVTLSVFLAISLLLCSESLHWSSPDALDTWSWLDWVTSLVLSFAIFCFVKYWRFCLFNSIFLWYHCFENIALLSSDCCTMADGFHWFFSVYAIAFTACSSLMRMLWARTLIMMFNMEVVCGCFNCLLKSF